MLGRLATRRGDTQRAIECYEKSSKLEEDAKAFFNLGLALRKMERFEEAAIAYKNAIRIDAANERAWVNLGYIQLRQHAFDEAQKSFEHALTLKPDYKNAQEGLADLEAARRNPDAKTSERVPSGTEDQ
jgi:Flp pilus assembly protein TadD